MQAGKLIVWLSVMVMVLQPAGAVPQTAEPQAVAKHFILMLVREDFKAAAGLFDETMTRAMTVETLANTWRQVVAQAGDFVETTAFKQHVSAPYHVVLVTCRFQQLALDIKVVLDGRRRVSGLFFLPNADTLPLPDYVNKQAFAEQAVRFGNPPWELPGFLCLPAGKGPFPGLVLVHGSGPQDRDETIGPNKPFRDIAWGLASQGIAVLRYDKRTKVYAKDMAQAHDITVKEETVDDAAAAAAFLRGHTGIDPHRVYILGHSLGGMVIPRIAAADKEAAGFIIMAGTSRPLLDVILEQYRYIFTLDGEIDAQEKKKLLAIEGQIKAIKQLSPGGPQAKQALLGAPPGYWLDLQAYQPAQTARGIKRPLLVLQGKRDYQVTLDDYQVWQDNLKDNTNVRFALYDGLNHLFIHGTGKSKPAEYQQAGHVYPQVIQDLAAWLKQPGAGRN